MKKIIYSAAGVGLGHTARARIVVDYLIRKGYQVKIITYGSTYDNLKNYFNDVEKISGVFFSYNKKNTRVKYSKTLVNNIISSPKFTLSLNRVYRIFKTFKPDLVISDFELITNYAANFKRLPLISIDNQSVITNAKIDCPKGARKEYLIVKSVIKLIVPKASVYIVPSFFQVERKNLKTIIVPPIIQKDIEDNLSYHDLCLCKHVLVYIHPQHKGLIDYLKKIKENFVVYGLNQSGQENNIRFRKNDFINFHKDLIKAKAVIANSGFMLISEALSLGKPYFAIPIKKQFEQLLNAYYIKKLHYGDYSEDLNYEILNNFLGNLDFYRSHLKKYQKNNNIFFDKLDRAISILT